ILLTPEAAFLDFVAMVSCRWVLVIACSLIVLREMINLRRLWNIHRPMRNEKINSGFTQMTRDENLINTGWDKYVSTIIGRLKSTPLNYGNFAVGITGRWGSGKTTFLKALRQAMEKDFIVAEFCAWQSNNPEVLIRDFFDCLASALHCNGMRYDFSNYIELLEGSGVQSYVKKIYGLFNHTFSVEQEKVRIGERLQLVNRPIVIFIDDVDRMDSAELMELFRIIRVTADFKNVIFIVAYDKQYVENQIEKSGLKNGNEYLKKIFPLEISLPADNREYVPQQLVNELKQHEFPDGFIKAVERQIQATRSGKYHHLLTNFTRTYRDVKNFVNSLLMAYDLVIENNLQKEISYSDMFWIELLRQFRYDVYEVLRNSPEDLLKFSTSATGNGKLYTYERPSTDKSGDAADTPAKLVPEDVSLILWILFGSNHDGQTSIRRVNNYRKYFDYRLPANIVSILEYRGLLQEKSTTAVNAKLDEICRTGKAVSLYHHLAVFKMDKCDDKLESIAKNYLYVVLRMVNIKPELEFELLVPDILDSYKCKIDVGEYVKNVIAECLKESHCSYCQWNEILAELHSREIFDDSDGSYIVQYRSILDDKSIKKLACENALNYLNSLTPPPAIEQITRMNTPLNKFVRAACVVTTELPEDNMGYKTNLILPALTEFYSRTKEQNDKAAFTAPFVIDVDDPFFADMQESLDSHKEALFGSVDKYKEFVANCFE
ncbi:MAG: KAP family NTPase, partial [Muribaculaceae bacterium]|nr:KAP family NTPase [Muribaculaceae bacterium]